MKKLDTDARASILTALVEGNSIASTCRMFGVSKITVLRLLADAGTLAEQYHDLKVCDLTTRRVQCDEIWAFVGAKQKNVPEDLQNVFGIGDVWTWVAIDADSKLVISYKLGSRNGWFAHQFMKDVADRLANKVQLTTDGLKAYLDAVDSAFGGEIDYAQLIKLYGPDRSTTARYSPPEVVGVEKETVCGAPQPRHISTSYIERQNLTVRMSNRRFTRLTNAFSKKLPNHQYMVALQYFHYNFIRVHMTIKTTPAVRAGITNKEWTMREFVQLLEREEELLGGRITDYKPAKKKISR
jgi:IS1 family transposase